MTFRLLAWTGPGGSVVAAEALKCDPQSESPRCRCADTLPMARERKVQEEKAVWGFAYQLTVITLGQLATFPCATLISPRGVFSRAESPASLLRCSRSPRETFQWSPSRLRPLCHICCFDVTPHARGWRGCICLWCGNSIAWMFFGPKKTQLLVALAFIAEHVKGLFLRFSVHFNQCCCGSLQDFLSYWLSQGTNTQWIFSITLYRINQQKILK